MDIRKRFWQCRHAQTYDNLDGLISGGLRDPDILPEISDEDLVAREVFKLLEEDLSEIDIVVTNLKRTTQTADRITLNRGGYIVEPDLRERELGELDGKITEAQQKEYSQGLPGEESKAAHSLRVVSGTNKVLGSKDNVLFITHNGSTNRVMDELGCSGIKIPNAQIFECLPVGEAGWKVFALSVEQGKLKRSDVTPEIGECRKL